MMVMLIDKQAGTPINFLPDVVVQIWRVGFVIVAALTLGQLVALYRERSAALPGWAALGHAAIALMLVRALVVQIERFDARLLVEGLPVSTVFVLLIWTECRYFVRGRDRRSDDRKEAP